MATSPFIFNAEAGETPETLDRKRKLLEQMLAGLDIGSPHTIGQGLSSLGKGIAAGVQRGRLSDLDTQQAAGEKSAADQMSAAMGGLFGGGGGSDYASSRVAGAFGVTDADRNAIAGIESGGNYGAVGPTHPKLGRALGKYQIMEANVGPWSKEALGREVSADEFLSNPDIQEQVFAKKFGGLKSKYGGENAARAWLGGEGAINSPGRKDSLGTSVGEYGNRYSESVKKALASSWMSEEPDQSGYEDITAPDTGKSDRLQPPVPMPPQPNLGADGKLGSLRIGGQLPAQGAKVDAIQPDMPIMPQGGAESAAGQEVGDSSLNAQSPIIRALMGLSGPDTASPGGAYPAAPQPQQFPPAPQQGGGSGMQQWAQIYTNPFSSKEAKMFAASQIAQMQKGSDPEAALDLQLKEAQLKKAQSPDKQGIVNMGGGVAYDPNTEKFIRAPAGEGGAMDNETFDNISGLRKEIQGLPSYKNIAQAAPIYKSMVDTAGRDSKASDLNLVYGLGKIMDPTSVVREGEIHMANDTQGMADYLNGIINGIEGKGRLSPKAREALMQEAYSRIQSYKSLFDQDSNMYKGIVQRGGFDEADVLPSFGEFAPWEVPKAPGAPAPAGTDASPAPEGIDPEDWKYLTPEQRRLWQN